MGPTLDTSARLQRTERVLGFIRTIVIAFNSIVYVTLAPHGDRHSIALSLIAMSAFYSVAVLLWRPEEGRWGTAIPVVHTVMENLLIVSWLWATGGFGSPWYPLLYAEAAACAGRFGSFKGGGAAAGSAVLYTSMVLIDGSGPLWVTLIRIGYIFVIAAFVGYVVEVSRGSERSAAAAESQVEMQDQLAQLKSTFVSNVSHELRTPLTAIRGAATTLTGKTERLSDAEKATLIEMIDRQSGHLGSLIQDLLDFSRLDRGAMNIEIESMDISTFVEDQVKRLRANVSQDIEFRPLDHPQRILCDRTMMQKVLTNVVDNAAKFSPARSTITISITELPDLVSIEVQDQGIGISPEEQERIFDRFYQVDDSMTRTAQGAGLDLNMAREMLRLHGGSILVDSLPDRGASFYIRLPKEIDPEPPARALRSA